MLKREAQQYCSVARLDLDGAPYLGCVQEHFGQAAVREAAQTCSEANAKVLELYKLVLAAVR